jgi:pyruvate formate lyase activating enzyme
MHLAALHKTTLLDFPGRVAALVFVQGCNFRCPYCHNPGLVPYGKASLETALVMDFLERRRRVLDGVVISGGEPALQPDLPSFCAALKEMGYAVKLDSNGSRPDMLRRLLEEGLLDYVALDVKTDPARYPESLCSRAEGVAESLEALKRSGVRHEFRVTCVAPFVTVSVFPAILEAVRGREPLFLQRARPEGVLTPSFFQGEGRALEVEEIGELARMARRAGQACETRGC